MKHTLGVLFVVLLAALPGWSQPAQPARIELPLDSYNSEVRVQALPADSSLILLVEQENLMSYRGTFSFRKYNRALEEVWTRPIDVPKEYAFSRLCAEGTNVYALFQSEYAPQRLWVASLDGRQGLIRAASFDTRLSRDIFDLKALEGNLFVTVMVDRHLTVVFLDLKAGTMQFLPSVYEPMPAQLTFLADSTTKRAEFVMSQSNGYKSRLQVKQLSARGQLLHSEFVQTESERGLITAQISPRADSTTRLLAGTYSLRDTRYSQGIFSADLTAGTTPTGVRESLRFYDFINLKHFFDFMKPAREERLRQRSARLRAEAKQLRLRYRLLTHDLMPFQDGYVMVAEVYYPHYRYDTYGYGLMASTRTFDGYRTTHAIVCGFDKKGNLLWDNAFVLKDVRNYNLVENVRVRPLPDGNRLVLAYLDEHRIRYKIIDRTVSSPNDLDVPIVTSLKGAKEKPNSTTHEGLLSWYGSRFLAYGYQHVRPEKGSSRDVFFVNSVAFD
ncbi:hypothetical protein LJY25_10665 [Hymenobacter sp. BT175]|uniref:hypothetical protein n=1 Tax=Hymenobacter translucens TaxID=2886507 RepID=UPI001D0E2317|nr:hypothetical protein [Hymenobacter translucens]MCC2546907.1 hypothetical protein [Hymenobacter translucens]